MAITRTPIIDDDGTGTSGTVIDNAWKQEFYNQIDGYVTGTAGSGVWTDVPFSAANFSGVAPLVWTVGAAAVIRNQYQVQGKILFWSLYLSWFSGGNVIGGSAGPSLQIAIPGGHLLNGGQMVALDYTIAPGQPLINGLYGDATSAGMKINKSTGANWNPGEVPGIICNIWLDLV